MKCALSWLAYRRELFERAFPASRCSDARVVRRCRGPRRWYSDRFGLASPGSQVLQRQSATARARGADYPKLLHGHPYIRDLHTEGDTDARAAHFIDRAEEHGGISLKVVEDTGAAGDVILLHPLVLHVATPNTSNAPRFLLSGGVDLPSMWTA